MIVLGRSKNQRDGIKHTKFMPSKRSATDTSFLTPRKGHDLIQRRKPAVKARTKPISLEVKPTKPNQKTGPVNLTYSTSPATLFK